MKKIAILIAIAVALFGCVNSNGDLPNNGDTPNGGDITDPENPQTTKNPGKFSATVLSDAFGSRSAARGVSLGNYTVSNSKSIYFILRNVGDFPITGIKLTAGKLTAEGETFVPITDNGVTASPGQIAVLETSGNTTVETIIEVAINHGNVVGLISQQYIQKADFAGTTIRITGKTTDEDDNAADVSLDVDIETLIKVASFELQYSVDGTTWKKAEYDKYPNDNTALVYLVSNAGKNHIKILNTGNVPLKYKAGLNHEVGNYEMLNEWKNLAVGEYSENLSSSWAKQFIVDTLGVAFDNGGIDDLIFRANTSIVISSFSANQGSIIWLLND
jgi:hypothetical protein